MAQPTCHAFLVVTLDNYIARSDGSVDFLDEENRRMPPGEDCGIAAFLGSVDAIIMGRTTYLQALQFKEDGKGWLYGDTPLYVLSRTAGEVAPDSPASVKAALVREHEGDAGLRNLVGRIGRDVGVHDVNKGARLYVDGGEVVTSFIRAGLLFDITLTVVPLLIGEGRRLFGATEHDVHMELQECRSWDFGFVQIRHEFRYGSNNEAQ